MSDPEFWKKTVRVGKCLMWTGATQSNGYGSVRRGPKPGVKLFAHRYAYELTKGPIPPGKVVRHKCHNRLCVEPDHLVTGTYKQNSRDMVRAGRSTAGEKNYHATLTDSLVLAIRKEYVPKSKAHGARALAEKHGICLATMMCILGQQTWKHLPSWRQIQLPS